MDEVERQKRYNEMKEMRDQRYTLQEIGNRYGITKEAVRTFLNRPILEKRQRVRKYPEVDPVKFQGMCYVREAARIRDKHTCQDCKKVWEVGKRRFDCHHINNLCGKRSLKYDKSTDGLITLCHKCHFNRPEHKVRSKEWAEARRSPKTAPKPRLTYK